MTPILLALSAAALALAIMHAHRFQRRVEWQVWDDLDPETKKLSRNQYAGTSRSHHYAPDY